MNTTKELAMTEEQALAKWRARNVTPRTKMNIIKVDNSKLDSDDNKNPNFGKIIARSYVGEEETVKEIKAGDSFFPIKVMVAVKGTVFEETNGRSKPKYVCAEVERFADIEVKDFSSGEVVYSGPYKDAKEEFGLKYKLALYVFFEGTVYRWEISGQDTLGSYFEVERVIQDIKAPYSVKVNAIIPQKNNGIFWSDVMFEVGAPFPVKEALELQDLLSKKKKEQPQEQLMSSDGTPIDDEPDFLK